MRNEINVTANKATPTKNGSEKYQQQKRTRTTIPMV